MSTWSDVQARSAWKASFIARLSRETPRSSSSESFSCTGEGSGLHGEAYLNTFEVQRDRISLCGFDRIRVMLHIEALPEANISQCIRRDFHGILCSWTPISNHVETNWNVCTTCQLDVQTTIDITNYSYIMRSNTFDALLKQTNLAIYVPERKLFVLDYLLAHVSATEEAISRLYQIIRGQHL